MPPFQPPCLPYSIQVLKPCLLYTVYLLPQFQPPCLPFSIKPCLLYTVYLLSQFQRLYFTSTQLTFGLHFSLSVYPVHCLLLPLFQRLFYPAQWRPLVSIFQTLFKCRLWIFCLYFSLYFQYTLLTFWLHFSFCYKKQ